MDRKIPLSAKDAARLNNLTGKLRKAVSLKSKE
jgi:hypothetical protein